MCYINGIRISKEQTIKIKDLEYQPNSLNGLRRWASGFDYSDWPIVKPIAGERNIEVQMAHWELIPSWTKNREELQESRKKFTTLNATAEKLLSSKMFRDAALRRRCLVLSSGFVEWRHYTPEHQKKAIAYPYYIDLPGQEYFYMAGIWQPWTDKETGETLNSFAIVTTGANNLMEQVHNVKKRMPTILTEDLAYEWLQEGLIEERIQQIASYQFDSDEMFAHTIRKDFKHFQDAFEEVSYDELPGLL